MIARPLFNPIAYSMYSSKLVVTNDTLRFDSSIIVTVSSVEDGIQRTVPAGGAEAHAGSSAELPRLSNDSQNVVFTLELYPYLPWSL